MTETPASPIVPVSPLTSFEEIRARVLDEVSRRTAGEFENRNLDLVLGETLYSERLRLKRDRPNVFTRGRSQNDRALLGGLQSRLLRPAGTADRKGMVDTVVRHFAEEIGGHFDPAVYRFATHAIPFLFDWLLNYASVRKLMPWKLKESVESRLSVVGEIEWLRKLSTKGTILLVPTHQSNIDSILIGYIIYLIGMPPFAYGAGLNLFSNPILSYFMGNLGAYTVDRKKNNAIYKSVLKNYSTVILREGVHSIFFPGGGRSRSGALETKLKLGLLGTALDAQIEGIKAGKPNPNVYIVPMVTSYHFVLEASSLIEDYLMEAGKARFIITDDESWQAAKILKFFFKLFSSASGLSVRIGRPLDVFGNFVDEEGRSIGPNGTAIDPRRWLTTRGVVRAEPQRDQVYTRQLGERLVDRFHHENTVLTSHLVAFAFFEQLRRKYPDLDLYRFLRLSLEQRSLPIAELLESATRFHTELRTLADRGELFLSKELQTSDTRAWVKDGMEQLGLFHEAKVLAESEGAVWTEDMNLLYYYRNRLAGYGISLYARHEGEYLTRGSHDRKGFLA